MGTNLNEVPKQELKKYQKKYFEIQLTGSERYTAIEKTYFK